MTGLLVFFNKFKFWDLVLLVVGVALAFLLRLRFLDFESSDYLGFVGPWYTFIKTNGFEAFRFDFSNYTPLYLYFLYIMSVLFPNLPSLIAVKMVSVACDALGATVVARLVHLKYSRREFSILAFLALLFTPTVVLNSSLWGQADILYTTALLSSIYFLALRREVLAFVAFGIAFSLKLQAMFLAPLLFVLFLKRIVSWTSFLLIPAVYVVALLPAWIVGRSFGELITIYLRAYPKNRVVMSAQAKCARAS